MYMYYNVTLLYSCLTAPMSNNFLTFFISSEMKIGLFPFVVYVFLDTLSVKILNFEAIF